MTGSRLMHWILCCLAAAAGVAGCSTDAGQRGETGSLSVDLVLAGGIEIDQVGWQITGNDMNMSGDINVSAPGSTASVEVFGLPPEKDYTVTLTATSTDETVTCEGSADFDVEVGQSADVMVMLNCKKPRTLGGVRVNGKFNYCAELTKVVVSPLQTSVGNDISLSSQAFDEEGDAISYSWTGDGGSIADPTAASTTFTCQEVGDHMVTILVTDNDVFCKMATWTVPVTCVEGDGGDLCEDVMCEDDGNECTVTECNSANGNCETSNVEDGTDCDGGTCASGVCVEDNLCEGVDCNDDNECTADACDPADGSCSNMNVDNGTPCADDTGMCVDGSCMVSDMCEGVVCDDTGSDCTVAMCNTSNGLCETMNVTDGTVCNGGAGACSAGVCIDDSLCDGVDCTSSNDCVTDGTCDPASGNCVAGDNQPVDTACATGGTVCDGNGSCVECNSAGQCADDGNECTAAACEGNACAQNNVMDGQACDFGGSAGMCEAGTCVAAAECTGPGDCDDGNPCTADSCPDGMCVFTPADGGACEVSAGVPGTCAGGACVGLCDGVDCSSTNDCIQDGTCDPANGQCQAGAPEPLDTACASSGGSVCDGAGACVECNSDGQCAGTDICTGNACVPSVVVPDPVTKAISLGCTNNLTTDISVLPWEMEAAPQAAIVGGQAVSIDFAGTAIFTESFLDAGLAAVPGLNKAAIAPGNRGGETIVPKSGLTGGDAGGLELEPAPIPLTCAGGMNAGGACTSQNDCPPVGYFACSEVVSIPTIDGTGDACAACNALGSPKDTQCAANGFCIAPGGLPLPLESKTGNYTAAASGTVLLGWDETNQSGLDADGAYIIPAASFTAPWQPGGLRVVVGILQIALNCVMAVPAGVDTDVPPDGIPDGAGPTPDADLISFAIQ